jgi:hypothetical protein
MTTEDLIAEECVNLSNTELRARLLRVKPADYPVNVLSLTRDSLIEEIIFLETYCG